MVAHNAPTTVDRDAAKIVIGEDGRVIIIKPESPDFIIELSDGRPRMVRLLTSVSAAFDSENPDDVVHPFTSYGI